VRARFFLRCFICSKSNMSTASAGLLVAGAVLVSARLPLLAAAGVVPTGGVLVGGGGCCSGVAGTADTESRAGDAPCLAVGRVTAPRPGDKPPRPVLAGGGAKALRARKGEPLRWPPPPPSGRRPDPRKRSRALTRSLEPEPTRPLSRGGSCRSGAGGDVLRCAARARERWLIVPPDPVPPAPLPPA
jgi:hypothetical protein